MHHHLERTHEAAERVRGVGRGLPQNSVLFLQRAAGNRAVGSIVSAAASATERRAALIGFEQTLLRDVAQSEPAGQVVTAAGRVTPVRRGGSAGSDLCEMGSQGAAMGDVVLLAESAPDVRSPEGQSLLQHEAAHIDQQRAVGVQPAASLKERAASEVPGHQGLLRFIGYSFGASTVARKAAAKAARWLAKRGASVSGHVISRHIARKLGKSRFIQENSSKNGWRPH